MEFLEPSAAPFASLPVAIRLWFQQRFGEPTAIQRAAWPAFGRNLLISAPTGTGKTLAAFLPLLSDLLTPLPASPWQIGAALSALYISPLKALAYDVCRNLTRHLDEIAAFLPGARLPRLAVRTGDTSAEERAWQIHDPPDILLTTPESLAVLLSQPDRQGLFTALRWVVVDEIHSLAATKRGADLSLSLERLAALSSVVRFGLSATATPLEEAARFLVGVDRPCAIAAAHDATPLRLDIAPLERTESLLPRLATRLEPELRTRRTTLIFTNVRALAERLAWLLRQRMPDWNERIAVHHSSLSAERRREVERRFKAGELGAVVSSTSLELGIDIGSVDLVVLIHPPGDVVRLLQRVGRAGHGPGRVRHGLVLTDSASELLEAAVTAASGRANQCEPLHVPGCPLDVLCQQILGMACAGVRVADDVYALVRRATPFRDLSRRDFDDCLAYLFGRDRDGNDWLPSRLAGDATSFSVRDERTARLLRRNLGTILAEEPATVLLRLRSDETIDSEPPTANIGTLDLSYAERLQPGDRMLLDGRCLEVRRVTGSEVHVEETIGRPVAPRWGGDGWPLSRELARRLYLLRVQAAEALREGPDALAALLRDDYKLEGRAVAILAAYFHEQEAVSEIPDAGVCLIERVARDHVETYHFHTPLNRIANDALSRVAVRRLARDHGRSVLAIVADLGFSLMPRGGSLVPAGLDIVTLMRRLLEAHNFDADLNDALAEGELVRGRFERVSQTGLMVLRNPLGRKRRVGGRDWSERRLYEQIRSRDPDFVLLRQAMREVKTSACDGQTALAYARSLPSLSIRCRCLNWVSPFARAWTQALAGALESVESIPEALERLHASLMDARQLGDVTTGFQLVCEPSSGREPSGDGSQTGWKPVATSPGQRPSRWRISP